MMTAATSYKVKYYVCSFPMRRIFFTEAHARAEAQEGQVSCKAGRADRGGTPREYAVESGGVEVVRRAGAVSR